jgi:hypothetical protein
VVLVPTTIQVHESTLLLLKALRKKFDASSYDELIKRLASEEVPESLAGFLGKASRAEILKDLRDEDD